MSPWGGVTGKFTKNVTFSASAAEEDWKSVTMTLKAGTIRDGQQAQMVFKIYGYDSSHGSLSPNTFKYEGTEYTITSLMSNSIYPASASTPAPSNIQMMLSKTPPFSKIVINVKGMEVVLNQSSSTATSFSSATNSKYEFAANTTYTVKIISVS